MGDIRRVMGWFLPMLPAIIYSGSRFGWFSLVTILLYLAVIAFIVAELIEPISRMVIRRKNER